MATTIIEEFFVKVGLDAPLGPLKALGHAVESIATRLVSLDVAFVAAAVGAVKFVQHVVDEAEGYRKLGERIGATGEQVENYVEALGLVNIPQAQAEESLTALSMSMGRAASGMARTQKVFEDLGVAYKDTTGKLRPTLVVLDELRAKLGKMPRGEAEAFLERLGIGSDYAKTLKFDLHGLQAEIEGVDHALGVNGELLATNAKKSGAAYRGLTKEINLWKVTLSAASKASATSSMPALTRLFERLTARLQQIRQVVTDIFAKLSADGGSVLTPLIEAFTFLADTVLVGFKYFVDFIGWLATSGSTLATAARWILGVAAAVKVLNLRFLQSPVFWFVALGLAIVAVVDDFKTFLDGGDSLFGRLPTWGKMLYGLGAGLLLVVPTVLLIEKSILALAAAKAFWSLTILQKVIPTLFNLRVAFVGMLRSIGAAAATNPMVLIIAAVVAAVALLSYGIYKLVQNWDAVKAKLLGIWNSIKGAASSFADAFVKAMTFDALVNTMEWVVGKWEWFKTKLFGIWDGVKDMARSIGDLFKGAGASFNAQAPALAGAGGTVLGGPTVAGTTTNNNQRTANVEQKVNITINSTDPQAAGAAVKSALDRGVAQGTKRNARGGMF